MSDVINIASPCFDPFDSYGQLAVRLALHLTQAGQRVNAYGGGVLHPNQPANVQAILRRPVRAAVGGIVLGYPTGYHHYGALVNAGPRVAVTMFESTKLPPGWAESLNQCQTVIVPSPWLAPVFRDCGVTIPIRVVPLGISETYQYVRRPANRKPFTFLTLGDRMWRKGWDVTARAFAQAFGTNLDYQLVIKCREQGLPVRIGHSHITVLAQDMTEAEMQALYASADAYVFATRGEGFGLPPREAAATGLPTIVTGWSGTADDAALWGLPLKSKLVPAWPGEVFEGLGEWAEPDFDHLVELMLQVARRDPSSMLLGRLRAQRVRRLYDWRQFAAGVLRVWREVTEKEQVDGNRTAAR